MAITHKFLKALGIDEDKAEEILTAHLETVNSIKAERDELKTKAETVDTLTAERDKLKADLDAAKKAGGDAAQVQADFDAYKAEVEKGRVNDGKKALIRKALEAAGANPAALDLLLNTVELDKVELDGDKLKDGEAVVNGVKDGHAGLFGEVKHEGTPPLTPPPGGSFHGTGRAAKIAAEYQTSMYGAPVDTGAGKETK